MLRLASSLLSCRQAAAAAEMAMIAPMLIALMFGAFEVGNYFRANHIVAKAVRDGARYAARRSFMDYDSCAPSADAVSATRNVTRTGKVGTGGTPRISYWTNAATISVTADCDDSGSYTGIYTDLDMGAPVVTVSAIVPYTPLYARFGLISTATFTIQATAEAAVTGV